MIVEKELMKAVLTGQTNKPDDHLMLEIKPHPGICGCCILTILRRQNCPSEEFDIRAAITVNVSELTKVCEMLSGVGL